jgi:hypothetical protein
MKERIYVAGLREKAAEENIWTLEGRSGSKKDKIVYRAYTKEWCGFKSE